MVGGLFTASIVASFIRLLEIIAVRYDRYFLNMHGQREVPQGYQQRLPAGDIIEEPSAPGYGESMKRYDSLLSRSSSQRVIVKQPVQKFVLEPGTPC